MESLSFYIKLTKKCNLRCAYCYEQGYFKDPSSLSLANMDLILRKIKSYCLSRRIKKICFGYAGGEVLTLGKEYLTSLLRLNRQIFRKSRIKTDIEVQTNLTLMDEEYINIFKKYKVGIGISYDVVGRQRKFGNGKAVDSIIIDKMILMLKNKLLFGGIVVVNKKNYKKASQIYDFYRKIYMNFHALRIHPWIEKYSPELVLTDQEYIEFLKTLADKHFNGGKPEIPVANLDAYIKLLTKGRGGEVLCRFARDCQGHNLFIEPDGGAYPCFNLQYKEFLMGNVLHDSLKNIFSSSVSKYLKKRYKFVKKECRGCKYFEICSGGCMAYARLEGNILRRSRSECAVNQAMFKYIGGKLKKQGKKLTVPV